MVHTSVSHSTYLIVGRRHVHLDRRASRARHARARATAAMPDADDSRDDTLPVVCVFGSVNVDHAFRCATALPRAGETVGNATYARGRAGKGRIRRARRLERRLTSFAIASGAGDDPVARRGVRVEFVGCVGAGDECSLAALRARAWGRNARENARTATRGRRACSWTRTGRIASRSRRG